MMARQHVVALRRKLFETTKAALVANWDVFHADRLELERGLSSEQIRAALGRGDLRDDDLVRPARSSVPWSPIADHLELIRPGSGGPPDVDVPPATPTPESPKDNGGLPDFEDVQPGLEDIIPPPRRHDPTIATESTSPSDVAFPVLGQEPPEKPKTAPPQAPAPNPWIWNDDEEDEDDEEDDSAELDNAAEARARFEDLDDIEIISDEEDEALSPARPSIDSGQPQAVHPAEPESSAAQPARWELGEHDLDFPAREDSRSSHVALPVVRSRDRDENVASEIGDEEDGAFSLSRSATDKIEELDLAPMVDVAFNLVLFFMVTATTVLYKTLEIPKPTGEAPAAAVAQGRSRSLDDLKDDYILVEIDEAGAMKLDREPIAASMETLVEQLRRAREKTGRKTMLLSAEYSTLHRNAVLPYDAANEIGLGIAIAKPQGPLGPAPTLRGAGNAPPRSAPKAAPPAPGTGSPF